MKIHEIITEKKKTVKRKKEKFHPLRLALMLVRMLTIKRRKHIEKAHWQGSLYIQVMARLLLKPNARGTCSVHGHGD